jgi:hypothetical protein
MHHCHHTAHNIYPIHDTIVKVPIQTKLDVDDEDLTCFHFGSSQESKIDPPLVLDSVWDCPGITLDSLVDDDGKTIPGWCCSYCLIPSNRGGHTLQRRRTLSLVLACKTFLQMLSMP